MPESSIEDQVKMIIYWLRKDLRLYDNPSLIKALDQEKPITFLYIYEDKSVKRALGGASQWWLYHSLLSLKKTLEEKGSTLILRKGEAHKVLKSVISETRADTVVWSRRYNPDGIATDKKIKADLEAKGIKVYSQNTYLFHEPWIPQTKTGLPFKVFTPFWKHCLTLEEPFPPLKTPKILSAPPIPSDDIETWELTPPWSQKLASHWRPGEKAALKCLDTFLEEGLASYKEDRNRPDHEGTSRLSPYLHWGEISVRTIWHKVHEFIHHHPKASQGAHTFLSELGWREFNYHLLYHNPTLEGQNFNSKFDTFQWLKDPAGLEAWQKGQTGIPIVDAGMRQLWETGWMHNRVRMIVASFLIKHLLVHWKEGEEWFWDTLVDADPANNAGNWQWVAGCGADAAPYFRIFNPILQGEKFDPKGDYVKKWVPELKKISVKDIHKPWESNPAIKPIIDLSFGRERALEAYRHLKS